MRIWSGLIYYRMLALTALIMGFYLLAASILGPPTGILDLAFNPPFGERPVVALLGAGSLLAGVLALRSPRCRRE